MEPITTTTTTLPPPPGPPASAVDDAGPRQREEWVKKMRGWLMVLAVLAASVTYQAGLNPPGGFWQEDLPATNTTKGHTAGYPVLANNSPVRYSVFVACNASAFVTSLVIMVLLLKEDYFHRELRLDLLRNFLIGNNVSLVVAYTVGSSPNIMGSMPVAISLLWSLMYIKWDVWRKEKKMAAVAALATVTTEEGTGSTADEESHVLQLPPC